MKEKILKTGPANWCHGIGTQGGKLVLTNTTLYFEAHALNVGKKECEIDIEDIVEIRSGFLNNLVVETKSGTQTFVVNGKKDWINAINSAIEDID